MMFGCLLYLNIWTRECTFTLNIYGNSTEWTNASRIWNEAVKLSCLFDARTNPIQSNQILLTEHSQFELSKPTPHGYVWRFVNPMAILYFFSLSCYLSCACRKRSLSQSVCLSQMCNHIASSARHFILISHALFRNKFIPIYYRLRTHCMHRIYLVWF